MSFPIDPKEVYQYLQELGYENISTRQLREFIRDLKKLIKYDERKMNEQRNKENVCRQPERRVDTFETLYEKQTEATKAKTVPQKKEKLITVQIKKHKETCRHYKQITDVNKEEFNADLKLSQVSLGSKNSDKTEGSRESDKIVAVPSTGESKKSKVEMQGFELKPKASFIRPKSSAKNAKSDPVSLYHRYQAEWKKQKIPGEENYSNLRWVIREKMLGEQGTQTTDARKRRTVKNS